VGLPRCGERLTDTTGLPKAEFGFPGTDLRRRLVAAILSGEKTSTTGLLADYQREGESPGTPGDRSVVVDADDREVGIIELTEVTVRRMADVDLQFARDEGEGFETIAAWREAHERFWNGYLDETLTDDSLVVCERFRLVERL
jgi:uncharacterized protein YhfF